jgi:hypothetical protein
LDDLDKKLDSSFDVPLIPALVALPPAVEDLVKRRRGRMIVLKDDNRRVCDGQRQGRVGRDNLLMQCDKGYLSTW